MKQAEIFGNAIWVAKQDCDFPVLAREFWVPENEKIEKAELTAVGLGFCRYFVNGQAFADHAFLPLSSDYQPRVDYPVDETLHGHRLYVPVLDVTGAVKPGENTLNMWFGGGWYCYGEPNVKGRIVKLWNQVRFGEAKAIYRLCVTTDKNTYEFVSSKADAMYESGVFSYCLTTNESRDLRVLGDTMVLPQQGAPAHAIPAPQIDTEYMFSDCPTDALIEEIKPQKLHGTVFDAGINTVGFPVLRVFGASGETVTVTMSEEINAAGELDQSHIHKQKFSVICDGTERIVRPEFIWYGFRYFEIEGAAEPVSVHVVHADIPVTSSFESSDKILNYLYRTYVHTQLCNMHAGIPSDCPHIERRGYTGDGQLTANAAMTMLDARSFYQKWIGDISDCQDVLTGHIQYTAPYIQSGGGPGAWGCAIVELPWQYYLHYGDAAPMTKLYPQMKEYFRYLEDHSVNDLVVTDKEGEWCLGDWCDPQQMVLPPAFVNTYYYVKALEKAKKIAAIIGQNADIPGFEATISRKKRAINAAYFEKFDSNYLGNYQGGNAFAVDIGLGNQKTYEHLVQYYDKLGEFDTGICGTDVVIRVLFEHGNADTAMKLLSSEHGNSFGGMMHRGATTLWEYWPEGIKASRSLNHPMFGACTAYLFEYVLGIRQQENTVGWRKLVISPYLGLDHVAGSRKLPCGTVSVRVDKKGDCTEIAVTMPENADAYLLLNGEKLPLHKGENNFSVPQN